MSKKNEESMDIIEKRRQRTIRNLRRIHRLKKKKNETKKGNIRRGRGGGRSIYNITIF